MELKHKKSYAASEKNEMYFASYSFLQDMITE